MRDPYPDWDREQDRLDAARDYPVRETVTCVQCEAEVREDEALQVARKPHCHGCALVEFAKIVARHLEASFSPTEAQVTESEAILTDLDYLLGDVQDIVKRERRKFDRVAISHIGMRRSL